MIQDFEFLVALWMRSYFENMHWIGVWNYWHQSTELYQQKFNVYKSHSRKNYKESIIYARNKENKSYSSKHWVNTSDWYIYEREHIKKSTVKQIQTYL